jgi:hypothetical protein
VHKIVPAPRESANLRATHPSSLPDTGVKELELRQTRTTVRVHGSCIQEIYQGVIEQGFAVITRMKKTYRRHKSVRDNDIKAFSGADCRNLIRPEMHSRQHSTSQDVLPPVAFDKPRKI